MKKLIYIVAGILLLGSCTEGMLDLKPTTSITDAAVWSDAKLIRAYHTALYNCIPTDITNFNNWLSRATDEAFPAVTGGPSAIHAGTLSPDNIDNSLYYWNTGYQYLRKINVFLGEMETTTVTLDDKDRLVAECKFLKAYIYFILTTRFGSCILMDDYYDLNEVENISFSRSSFDECVAEIEKLINEALPALPDYYMNTDANFGRATKDVCYAMLSRMYTYFASPLYNPSGDKSKWEKAVKATEHFITGPAAGRYELHPDYQTCFNQETGSQNKELIFGVNFSKSKGHNAPMDNLGRRWEGYGGWNAAHGPSQNLVDDYEMQSTGLPPFTWVNGVKTLTPNSGYDPQNPYNDRDPRFAASIIYNGSTYRGVVHEMWISENGQQWGYDSYKQSSDNPKSNYVLRKFMPEADVVIGWQQVSTVPWPIFRLAEMYMNYAEAKLALGDDATCREYMNKIRARVNMPAVPADMTGDALKAKLINECRVEFAFEAHRYFDLRRWKLAMEVENRDIYGMSITKNMVTGELTYTPELLFGKEGKFTEAMYLLPVKRDEIKKSNGSITQTPGWENY